MENLSAPQLLDLLKQSGRLTPEQYAEVIKAAKPYLVEIEDKVQGLEGGYGTIQVVMTVRAKVVAKMEFTTTSTWLPDKDLPKNDKL